MRIDVLTHWRRFIIRLEGPLWCELKILATLEADSAGRSENRWADMHGSCHGGTVSISKWPWPTTETENDFLKAYVKQVIIVSFISVELLMQSLKSLRLSVKLLHIQEEKSWSWNNSSPKNSFQTRVKSHQDENKHFICSAGNSFESCSVSDGV